MPETPARPSERTYIAITGASSGIGEAFARKLAPGHDLILIARRRDRLEALAREFQEKFDTESELLVADLADSVDLQGVAERLASESKLTLLVNNAGFGFRGRFWEVDYPSHEKMHRLHVLATLQLTHAVLPGMMRRNAGGIVNVSSVSSMVRSPGTTSYSATKAWMTAFTEGLHLDLQSLRSDVVVQALCPGFTYSEFHEVAGVRARSFGPGWWMTAEEVVDASIAGLRARKLIVVPGFRYQLLTALVPRLPVKLRMAFLAMGGPRTKASLDLKTGDQRQIGSRES